MDEALEDNNYWNAAGEAWRAQTWHPVAKFAIETAFDPASYVGWGIATKLVRPLPLIGRPLSRMVGAFEHGYPGEDLFPFMLNKIAIPLHEYYGFGEFYPAQR